MKLLELFEARRNPHLNRKEDGHDAAVSFVSNQMKKNPDIGISMTDIPKLGVNPRSKYNTPIGVYFYPGNYYLERKGNDRALDFQDTAPYIQVFSYSGNILYIDQMDAGSYRDCMKKMFNTVVPALASTYGIDPNKLEKSIVEFTRDAPTEALVKSPGGLFWFVMYNTARLIEYKTSKSKSPVIWNKIIRLLGYSAIVDNGAGIIHVNEPSQGVVVDTSKIKLLKTFNNINTDTIEDDTPFKRWTRLVLSQEKTDLEYITAVTNFIIDNTYEVTKDSKKLNKKSALRMLEYIEESPLIALYLRPADIKVIRTLADDYKIDDRLNTIIVNEMWKDLSTNAYHHVNQLLKVAEDPATPEPQKRAIAVAIAQQMKKFTKIQDLIQDISNYQHNGNLQGILRSVTDLTDRYSAIAR